MFMELQTNRIVPRSILRYRPITSETEQWSTRRTTNAGPPEIPTWHSQSQPSVPKTGAIVSSSASLAAVVGCGMVLALLLIILGQLVVGWAQITWDDWHYGRPRVSQVDQYVGHEQTGQPPSHFLALNNRGRVEVIELPGDDPTRARIFLGLQLTGTNADLVPVAVRFVDSGHTHYPDMIIQVRTLSIVFHNTHETFVLHSPPQAEIPHAASYISE